MEKRNIGILMTFGALILVRHADVPSCRRGEEGKNAKGDVSFTMTSQENLEDF